MAAKRKSPFEGITGHDLAEAAVRMRAQVRVRRSGAFARVTYPKGMDPLEAVRIAAQQTGEAMVVESVPCPVCKAAKGKPCDSSLHKERVDAADALFKAEAAKLMEGATPTTRRTSMTTEATTPKLGSDVEVVASTTPAERKPVFRPEGTGKAYRWRQSATVEELLERRQELLDLLKRDDCAAENVQARLTKQVEYIDEHLAKMEKEAEAKVEADAAKAAAKAEKEAKAKARADAKASAADAKAAAKAAAKPKAKAKPAAKGKGAKGKGKGAKAS